MAVTWAQVVLIAPALSTAPSGRQDLILAVVDRQIDDTAWGDLADDGRLYLAAHLGTVSGVGGAAGAVSSETLGPMSRSYGLPSSVSDELATTGFGVFYLHLLTLLPCSLGLVP